MGLAASQARLLTITARKADCEFESMTLSHQKLALSRDMERVSTEYQNAINQTKLVYDYYGSGDKQIDLTYGLLMEPSIYNDYLPRLVTDPQNRVILNSKYAAAARAAGIPAEGLAGTPSSDVRDDFINALCENGIITNKIKEAVLAVPYNNALGLGNTVSASASVEEITYDELLKRIQANTTSTSSYFSLGVDAYYLLDNELGDERIGFVDSSGSYTSISDGGSGGTATSLKLEDLLSDDKNYIISSLTRKGDELPICDAFAMQEKLAQTGGFLDWLQDQFRTVLGGVAANETALDYAYNCVFDLLVPNKDLETYFSKDNDGYKHVGDDKGDRQDIFELIPDGGFWRSIGKLVGIGDKSNLTKPGQLMVDLGTLTNQTTSFRGFNGGYAALASKYLGFTFTADMNQNFTHKDRNDKSQVSMSLSNLAQAFLTSYVQFMQGIEASDYTWQKGDKTDPSVNLYDGNKDKDFLFMVAGEVEVDDGTSQLYANFYDTLFNRICMNGWTENDNIEDKEYMQELLKNGMAFISTMSDDGFYYQGNYATDRTILEVTDDEAVARAQAKYNREKANIEYKEDRIDLKMKNLDTEISSLSTEYDTTKQLITKTVEKSFKRYDA